MIKQDGCQGVYDIWIDNSGKKRFGKINPPKLQLSASISSFFALHAPHLFPIVARVMERLSVSVSRPQIAARFSVAVINDTRETSSLSSCIFVSIVSFASFWSPKTDENPPLFKVQANRKVVENEENSWTKMKPLQQKKRKKALKKIRRKKNRISNQIKSNLRLWVLHQVLIWDVWSSVPCVMFGVSFAHHLYSSSSSSTNGATQTKATYEWSICNKSDKLLRWYMVTFRDIIANKV